MIIGVYPSVVSTFLYMYITDVYFFSMLFVALEAWFMVVDDWRKS